MYTAALREALAPYRAAGGTQAALAANCFVSRAAMSRYLSGERLAGRSFVTRLREVLAEEGFPLSDSVYERLLELCGDAHRASGSPSVQLTQLREDLAAIRQAQNTDGRRLADIEEQAAGLYRELNQARERAQAADGREGALTELVARQRDQLGHAQDYIRQLENELTEQTEQAALLLREVSVLRAQNTQLVEGTAPAVSLMDTSVNATLARRAARLRETSEKRTGTGKNPSGIVAANIYRPPAELLQRRNYSPGRPWPVDPSAQGIPNNTEPASHEIPGAAAPDPQGTPTPGAPETQETPARVLPKAPPARIAGRYLVGVVVPCAWIFVMMGVIGVTAAAGIGPHLWNLVWAAPLCYLACFLVGVIDYLPRPDPTTRELGTMLCGMMISMVSGIFLPFFWDPAFLFGPSRWLAHIAGIL
ncbi:hypothetical protein [Streptomyces clavifer]|uniref:hypothetical protein n=1 Tax=Streptomyces clavifer TaxID=68188 RepID=UPI00380DFC11